MVCELTLKEIWPVVPADIVERPIFIVIFAIWLTIDEVDVIEQAIFLGIIVSVPVLENAVAPLNACIEKLSE
jgi:hypothetical protein